MRKFGIKIISNFIKNPKKREFIYKFLSDWHFAESVMEREIKRDDCIKKLLFYAHNYLKQKNCVVVWIVGGLGNQMYCYAFGKALERRGYSVVFDCGTYRYAKNLYGGGIRRLFAINRGDLLLASSMNHLFYLLARNCTTPISYQKYSNPLRAWKIWITQNLAIKSQNLA